jgi:hypothetical protein
MNGLLKRTTNALGKKVLYVERDVRKPQLEIRTWFLSHTGTTLRDVHNSIYAFAADS